MFKSKARVAVLLGSFAFSAGALLGCSPTDPVRVSTTLGSDGYALFGTRGEGSDRLAFLVELRDAPDGTYVLLYSRQEPRSVGWFDIPLSSIEPCRRYGADAVDTTKLDCLVPDGYGTLVDVVTVAAAAALLPDVTGRVRAPGPRFAMLRHEVTPPASDAGSSSSSSSSSSCCTIYSSEATTWTGYYAVMRVEHDGVAVPIAAEVRVIDGWGSGQPAIERLR